MALVPTRLTARVIVASSMHDGFYDWQVKGKTRNKKTHSGWRPVKTKTNLGKDGRYALAGK